MRVAMILPGGVDESGREHVIPAIVWLIERLARRHEVFVYVLRYLPQPRSYPLRGATVRDLGRPPGSRRQYSATLAALRRDGAFDVIHGMWALPSGLIASLIGRRLRVPAIVTCDSGEFVGLDDIGYGSQLRARQRLAVRAATRLASRVTVCSEFQAGLARAHGVNPEVVPIGADRAAFDRSLTSPGETTAATDGTAEGGTANRFAAPTPGEGPPWRLLNVANLNPVKDHRTLLDGCRRIVAAGLDVHLDIAGEDTLNGAVQAYAQAIGVAPRVTFHGSLTTDRLAQLYQRAHLFVLTSRHEAAGVVVLEAGLSGVPVIGTSVGYIADGAGTRAMAVPAGDATALAAGIQQLLSDRITRLRLASAARDWALAHDADWTADAFSKLYRAVAAV